MRPVYDVGPIVRYLYIRRFGGNALWAVLILAPETRGPESGD